MTSAAVMVELQINGQTRPALIRTSRNGSVEQTFVQSIPR